MAQVDPARSPAFPQPGVPQHPRETRHLEEFSGTLQYFQGGFKGSFGFRSFFASEFQGLCQGLPRPRALREALKFSDPVFRPGLASLRPRPCSAKAVSRMPGLGASTLQGSKPADLPAFFSGESKKLDPF